MTTIKYPYENNKVSTSLVGRVTKYNRESALKKYLLFLLQKNAMIYSVLMQEFILSLQK